MHFCRPCSVSEIMTKSSANNKLFTCSLYKEAGLHVSSKICGKSFMKMLNNVGLSTQLNVGN